MASLLILLIESDYESDQDSSGDYGSSEDDDAISKRKRNKKGKSADLTSTNRTGPQMKIV